MGIKEDLRLNPRCIFCLEKMGEESVSCYPVYIIKPKHIEGNVHSMYTRIPKTNYVGPVAAGLNCPADRRWPDWYKETIVVSIPTPGYSNGKKWVFRW
jgi:hypothetical protein